MTQIASQLNWREIVKLAQEKHHSNVSLLANIKEIISIANASEVFEKDIIQLALHIGLKIYPRDRTFQSD